MSNPPPSRFKKGDRVILIVEYLTRLGISVDCVGTCIENHRNCPYIHFDGRPLPEPVHQDDLRGIRGDESELEKILLWTNYGK